VHDAALAEISRYYDTLHFWTWFNSGFRAFSGLQAGAIHRWLTDPISGEFSPSTIHRIMLSVGLGTDRPDALDAGCGYGGTMFAFAAALGGRWNGLTISHRQYVMGRNAAREKGLSDAVTFALKSYDEPQAQSYNVIYGIESLIHSAAPANTIGNLARALRPGGTFMIVDDMPADEVAPQWRSDVERFKALWRCPVMPTARQWSLYLSEAGCDVVEVRDLSAMMRPRASPAIAQAIEEVQARRRCRDNIRLRRIVEAEIGWLLLERLG
jgi:SAM-dependent methyltransferase